MINLCRGVPRIFQGGGGGSHSLIPNDTQRTYWSSAVFLVRVTIFRMSSECGGKGGGGQAYQIAAYYRSQTSVDKGVDISLRLKKSDHVITLLWLCGFERKQSEEKFPSASYFLQQVFFP